jgi:cold shock CspA family protein
MTATDPANPAAPAAPTELPAPAGPAAPAAAHPAEPTGPAAASDPAAAGAPGRSVQATVGTFDEVSGAGTALLDDGRRVTFDGAAFAAGGLRLLRFGQRVRLEYAGGRVARVTIHTLP